MGKTFVSIDVEAAGPTPGVHGLLSVGFCAVRKGKSGLYEVEASSAIGFNLLRPKVSHEAQSLMEGPDFHWGTLEWWKGQEEAWAMCRENPSKLYDAATAIQKWLVDQGLSGAQLAAWPSSYDVPWITWLLSQADIHNLFGHSSFCIGTAYRVLKASGFKVPKKRKLEGLREHVAKDDAIEQAYALADLQNALDRK